MSGQPTSQQIVAATLDHKARTMQKLPTIPEIILLSLADAGQYADGIAKVFSQNAQFCESQKEGPDEFEQWNQTSIANTAYLAIQG
jgi:hypothetical protein